MKELELVLDGVPLRVLFTRHAAKRMEERGIDASSVIEAIRSPCDYAYDRENDVYLVLGCNGVAVVYAQRGQVVEVVTVLREQEYRFLVDHVGPRRYRRLRLEG
jgi:hypothetical protein